MPALNKSDSKNFIQFLLNNKALLILVVIAVVAAIVTEGKFLGAGNLSSVARQISVMAILGIGMTFVIASGEVDLSIAQLLNFVAIVYGILTLALPLPLAVVLALVFGTALGLLNGVVTHTFKLPPFILTLATAMVFSGFAWILCDGKSISGLPDGVKIMGQGVFAGFLPVSVLIMATLMGVVALVMYRTRYGRHIIATGGNGEAARVSGINIRRIRISVYLVSGLFAAIGAIVLTGRVATALPNTANGMEMDAIAAVVIGGTPMSGGKAKVVGTVFGCVIIGIISNMLNLLNVSSFWQSVAKGLIIVLAIILDSQTEAFLNKKRESA